MASNNQKCVWVYAIGYELVHYFQTEEEADVWWASYKVEVGDDVEGAIEQVWMFQKPPPPVTQATMLKRTHEIQCGKCAISDYAENIGVWNDDGTLQELGLCGECEKPDIVGCCEKCDMEIVRDSDEHDNCLIGADDKFYCQHCPAAMCEMCESCYTNGGSISVLGRDISICENCDRGGDCYDGFLDEYHYNAETNDYEEKKEIVGKCEQCECDVTTDQDYLKLKTGPGAGRIYCEEHVGWGECQKAWSGSCGCDVCADQEEKKEECEICGATPEIGDDWDGYSVCDECFMCCEECYNTKNPAVFEKTASDLCECEDKVQCEHCEGAVSDEGGIIVVMGQEMTICENCDMGGDCYDGFLDEYHYNAETNDYEEKKEEDSEEVKQYKAVLAETLRYEAIMDMMKK